MADGNGTLWNSENRLLRWLLGVAFSAVFLLIGVVYANLDSRVSKLETYDPMGKAENRFVQLDVRLSQIDEHLSTIDSRLAAAEANRTNDVAVINRNNEAIDKVWTGLASVEAELADIRAHMRVKPGVDP